MAVDQAARFDPGTNSPNLDGAATVDAAVVIGSFQPFHLGHLASLEQALAMAPTCVVVLGGAFQARSAARPFTWIERSRMILSSVPPELRSRLRLVPVRDRHSQSRWASSVRDAVESVVGAPGSRVLLSHRGPEALDYLDQFDDWKWRHAVPGFEPPVSAESVRDAIFGAAADDAQAALRSVASSLPDGTLCFLRDWMAGPAWAQLKPEWQMLRDYRASWSAAPHPPVLFTADCIVRCQWHVLVIRRAHAPGKGQLGVPGGFMEPRETARQAAFRELHEETRLDVAPATLQACLKDTALFDRPGRSGRGRTLTQVHYIDLGGGPLPRTRAGDDAAAVDWVPIVKLADLEGEFVEDHFQMLDHFLDLPAPIRQIAATGGDDRIEGLPGDR